MKVYTLTVPLWDRYAHLLIGGGEVDVIRFVRKRRLSPEIINDVRGDTIDNGTRGAVWFCNKHGEGLIWFPNKRPTEATLAHEVTHLADYLMMFIGSTTEMEARAYTVDWLTSKIRSTLNK